MKNKFIGFIDCNGELCIDNIDSELTYTKAGESVSKLLCDAAGVDFKDGDKLVSFGDTFKVTVEKL